MREDAKTYNDKLLELQVHHNQILKDIEIANKMEIEELRRESEKLFGVKKDLREENVVKREAHDEVVWTEIDRLKERNKVELAKIIEAGMEHKAELTQAILKFKQSEFEKKNLISDIHQKHREMTDTLVQITATKQQLEAQRQEILDRK